MISLVIKLIIELQNHSETVTNEHDKNIPTEKYISLEER